LRRIVYSSSSASDSEGMSHRPGVLARHGNDDVIEITDSSDDNASVPRPFATRAGVVLPPLRSSTLEPQHDKLDDDGLLVL
jgi:hypothetical protein